MLNELISYSYCIYTLTCLNLPGTYQTFLTTDAPDASPPPAGCRWDESQRFDFGLPCTLQPGGGHRLHRPFGGLQGRGLGGLQRRQPGDFHAIRFRQLPGGLGGQRAAGGGGGGGRQRGLRGSVGDFGAEQSALTNGSADAAGGGAGGGATLVQR